MKFICYRLRICDLCFPSCPCLVVDLELGPLIRRSNILWFHITGIHYTSIDITDKDHLIIILSSTSIYIRFLYPFFRVDIMAGFHPPGDPYFPNQGNAGWLDYEPEDDHPIPLDDHLA